MENRILLLEDDVSLIDGLQYSLKKNGFDVDFVRSVQETLTYLSEIEKYDMLILDVTLPDGTGFEICEKVRKNGSQIPIIFLTASDEEVSIIRGLDCGGDDYIGNLEQSFYTVDIRQSCLLWKDCLWQKNTRKGKRYKK